jgi:hypothetical protein
MVNCDQLVLSAKSHGVRQNGDDRMRRGLVCECKISRLVLHWLAPGSTAPPRVNRVQWEQGALCTRHGHKRDLTGVKA